MGFGSLFAFLSSFGSGIPGGPGPYLLSSNPVNGATGIAPDAAVSFVIADDSGTVDPLSLAVVINGEQLIIGGAFIGAGAGSVVQDGTSLNVAISAHSLWAASRVVDCVIYVSDDAGNAVSLSFSFTLNYGYVSGLTAKTWCGGNRVDLAWTVPTGTTAVVLRRSKRGYCQYRDDPGDDMVTFIAPPVLALTYSDTALDDTTFYYYTVFYSFSASPYVYLTDDSAQVTGLSIQDYSVNEGYYAYNGFPVAERRADGDPSRGINQYLLRFITDPLQCLINLARGYADGLLNARDPDEAPAGQIGIPDNNKGIIKALCWELGFPVQPEFSVPALRRVAQNLVEQVLLIKGTCPSLVNLVTLITGWELRCDELIDPVCGVNRVFHAWDNSSQIFEVNVGGAGVYTGAGSLVIDPTTFTDLALNVVPLPNPQLFAGVFVLDAMGTFVCAPTFNGVATYTYDNVNGQLRSSITGTGSSPGSAQFDLTAIDHASYPWQFPFAGGFAAPSWGPSAWQGYKLKDHLGAVFTILTSAGTVAGTTHLTLSGTPANGAFTLAVDFNSGNPVFRAYVYAGRFSLAYDPKWDTRLAKTNDEGPWSFVSAAQGVLNNYGPGGTIADVILWLSGVASLVGVATDIGDNYVQDTTQAWAVDQWRGYYVNPNWGQTQLFRIVGNTGEQLIVATPAGDVFAFSGVGATYVILAEDKAKLYQGIARILPQFAAFDATVRMRFE